jgi:hypothetical protein
VSKNGNPAAAAATGGAGDFDLAGRQISTVATPERQRLQDQRLVALIRADLIGSDQCRAAGTTAHGPSPVLALCRELVAAKVDPDRPMHAYRGDMLCLVVRSIGEAAQFDISSKGTGFVRSRLAVRTAPPMSLNVSEHHRCCHLPHGGRNA